MNTVVREKPDTLLLHKRRATHRGEQVWPAMTRGQLVRTIVKMFEHICHEARNEIGGGRLEVFQRSAEVVRFKGRRVPILQYWLSGSVDRDRLIYGYCIDELGYPDRSLATGSVTVRRIE